MVYTINFFVFLFVEKSLTMEKKRISFEYTRNDMNEIAIYEDKQR